MTAGPVKEATFAFVLLGRAVDFFEMILARTHADRSVAEMSDTRLNDRLTRLPKYEQVQLTRLILRAHKGLNDQELLQLRDWILKLK